MNFFQPDVDLGLDESERHYLNLHQVFVRRLFKEQAGVLRYAPMKFVGRRDLLKGFDQRPDRWRCAMIQYAEQDFAISQEDADRLWLDDHNFLEGLRNYQLDEQVLHDGLRGQTACVKFVVLIPTKLGLDVSSEDWQGRLTDAFAASFGSRLLVLNKVLGSLKTIDRGREITADLADETDLTGILEVHFDNEQWGHEFFALPPVEELLALERADGAIAYQAVEQPALDRR
jgi:hypothetical protein